MKILDLNIICEDQIIPCQFKVIRMINAGYVGRDREAVKAHIEELRKEGVPHPPSVPMLFPVLSHNITTENQIEVIGGKTSGEVEYVLLFDGEQIFVGVGSDHTDRNLERQSITASKQICPNVLSQNVWKYEDVLPGWDDLVIQSWAKRAEKEKEILYQEAPLTSIISSTEILDLAKSRIIDRQYEGLVIFSGTVPILKNEIIYATNFRCELTDFRLKRSLTCEYQIKCLDYLTGTESR